MFYSRFARYLSCPNDPPLKLALECFNRVKCGDKIYWSSPPLSHPNDFIGYPCLGFPHPRSSRGCGNDIFLAPSVYVNNKSYFIYGITFSAKSIIDRMASSWHIPGKLKRHIRLSIGNASLYLLIASIHSSGVPNMPCSFAKSYKIGSLGSDNKFPSRSTIDPQAA